jgi:hypothetical protein
MGSKMVRLDENTVERLRKYSDATGVPMTKALNEMVTDWLNTVGSTRVALMTHRMTKPKLEKLAKTILDSINET